MSAGHRRRLSNPENQAQYLYESRGDSSSALRVYESLSNESDEVSLSMSMSMSRQHNITLLKYLADTRKSTEQAYLSALREFHSSTNSGLDKEEGENEGREKGVVSLQQLVLAHNLALHSFFNHDYDAAKEVLIPIFEGISSEDDNLHFLCFSDIKCKIAFLLIDCLLAVYEVEVVRTILEWIEKFIASRQESAVDEGDDSLSYTKESQTELKFRFHCYKARFLFLGVDVDETKYEVNTRLARKELKNAMEIYRHKLSGRSSRAESIGEGSASVQDSVSLSAENGNNETYSKQGAVISNGIGNDAHSTPDDLRGPFECKRSDSQNEHVLFLKAKLEHSKGNSKKSSKLCLEAQNTVGDKDLNFCERDGDDSGEMKDVHIAIYSNNVALIHQSARQPFLALEYYSRALFHIEQVEKESDCIQAGGININSDGTMNQISKAEVLYNSSICAKECGNYFSAYDCMALFLKLSTDLEVTEHPFPWLHIAECCIGIYSSRRNRWKSKMSDGCGSVLSDPLSNALTYVTKCIALCHKFHGKPVHFKKYLEPARVLLSYIWMELNNPAPVIGLADVVLSEPLSENESEKAASQRHRATIRMYACEAMSRMGNPEGGLSYFPPGEVDSNIEFLPDTCLKTGRVDLKASVQLSLGRVQSLARILKAAKESD